MPENSPAIDRLVRDLDADAEEADAVVLGLVRNGKRLPGRARTNSIRTGDILVVEAPPDGIDRLKGALKLEAIGEDRHEAAAGAGMALMEVVVQSDSRIVGRSSDDVRLMRRHNVSLLGVSRQGQAFHQPRPPAADRGRRYSAAASARPTGCPTWRMARRPAAGRARPAGDAISQGRPGGRHLRRRHRRRQLRPHLPARRAGCVAALFVITDIVPLREVYDHIEWPVVVLLGSMLPLGAALETSGGTALIAANIVAPDSRPARRRRPDGADGRHHEPVGRSQQHRHAVIAAPIAVDIASRCGHHPDPFLMAVAVAASCAFLTPIGHKNNTLIMGPGGYRFRRLLAHGPAAGNPRHRRRRPDDPAGLAAIDHRQRPVSWQAWSRRTSARPDR